jgi:hypothetical protein
MARDRAGPPFYVALFLTVVALVAYVRFRYEAATASDAATAVGPVAVSSGQLASASGEPPRPVLAPLAGTETSGAKTGPNVEKPKPVGLHSGIISDTTLDLLRKSDQVLALPPPAAPANADPQTQGNRDQDLDDRPDVVLKWLWSLEQGMQEAQSRQRPVVVIVTGPQSGNRSELAAERVCRIENKGLRLALFDTHWVLVRVSFSRLGGRFYYPISRFPTVLFLGPEGAELGRVEQPQNEGAVLVVLQEIRSRFENW